MRDRLRRLDELLRLPEGSAPRGPVWTGGTWGEGRFIILLAEPAEIETAKGNGVDVDRLTRAVLPDGREAPYLDLCSEEPLPVVPGSTLADLVRVNREPGSEEKRRALDARLGLTAPVHDDEPAPARVTREPAPVEGEEDSWTL
jgi:hypothetical protein